MACTPGRARPRAEARCASGDVPGLWSARTGSCGSDSFGSTLRVFRVIGIMRRVFHPVKGRQRPIPGRPAAGARPGAPVRPRSAQPAPLPGIQPVVTAWRKRLRAPGPQPLSPRGAEGRPDSFRRASYASYPNIPDPEHSCPTSRPPCGSDRSTSSTSNGIVRIDEKISGQYRPDIWEQRVMFYVRRDPGASQVAEADGKVIGFMLGDCRAGEFGLEQPSGWIERFGIDPDYRGQELGRRMFDAMCAHFRAEGATQRAHAGGPQRRGPRRASSRRSASATRRSRRSSGRSRRDTRHGAEGRERRAREEVPRRGRALAPAQLQGLRAAARRTGTSTSPRTTRSACAPSWRSARPTRSRSATSRARRSA